MIIVYRRHTFPWWQFIVQNQCCLIRKYLGQAAQRLGQMFSYRVLNDVSMRAEVPNAEAIEVGHLLLHSNFQSVILVGCGSDKRGCHGRGSSEQTYTLEKPAKRQAGIAANLVAQGCRNHG